LRIFTEAEKQLRISKNQSTWFTVALLQLSSADYPSTDADGNKLSLGSARNGDELGYYFSLNYYFFSLNP